jgi:hypothetical protein
VASSGVDGGVGDFHTHDEAGPPVPHLVAFDRHAGRCCGEWSRPHHAQWCTTRSRRHVKSVADHSEPGTADFEAEFRPAGGGVVRLLGLELWTPCGVLLVEEGANGLVEVADDLLLGNGGLGRQPVEATAPVGELVVGDLVGEGKALVLLEIRPTSEGLVPREAINVDYRLKFASL